MIVEDDKSISYFLSLVKKLYKYNITPRENISKILFNNLKFHITT